MRVAVFGLLAALIFAIGCDVQYESKVTVKTETESSAENNPSGVTPDSGDNSSNASVNARVVLKNAIAEAKAENKNLVVHFGADW